jgi:hypothetical protein
LRLAHGGVLAAALSVSQAHYAMDKLLCVCGRIGVVLLVSAQCVVFREQASGAGPHTRYVSWLRARQLALRIAGVAVREPARRSGAPVLAWNLQALTFHSRVITIPETVVRSTIQYECGKITDAIPSNKLQEVRTRSHTAIASMDRTLISFDDRGDSDTTAGRRPAPGTTREAIARFSCQIVNPRLRRTAGLPCSDRSAPFRVETALSICSMSRHPTSWKLGARSRSRSRPEIRRPDPTEPRSGYQR